MAGSGRTSDQRFVTARGCGRALADRADCRTGRPATVTDSNTNTKGITWDRCRARMPKLAIVPKPNTNIST